LNINWNAPSSYLNQVQGVFFSLYNKDNNFLGQITKMSNNGSGSYNWIIPVAVSNPNNDARVCKTINNIQICGGSPINEIITGTYKIRATFFTPSNACFGFCVKLPEQRILGYIESLNFNISK
jgi:hypothetical protein